MADIAPQSSFETLKKNVVNTITSFFPFEGAKQKLVLDSIHVDDNLDMNDIHGQQDAKDHEKTWGVPVKATFSLFDKETGNLVDKKSMTLATIPKLTPRYGYIVNGNEYQVDHLFRLRPGVYTRVQENGDLESEFNIQGKGFSVLLNRETKQFFFKRGNSHILLYPLLKAMGMSDDQLEHQWGKDIFLANKPATEKKFHKELEKFYYKTATEEDTKPSDLSGFGKYAHDFFTTKELDPETTKLTLGKGFTNVTGETLQLAANKILGVSRGTDQPDDRDSLAFKGIYSAEDFIPETIVKSTKTIRARMRATINHRKTVAEILSPDAFKRPIREFFTSGGSITERSDQTNPIQMLGGHHKTTLMSAELGGIKSENHTTDSMQVINPSHFGFLDPMHTPESERTGITLYLGMNAKKVGNELALTAYNLKTGKPEQVKAVQFHHDVVAVLPDQVRWENGKPKPIAHNVKVKLPGGAIEVRPFSEATHVMTSAKGMFDTTSNLIPFLPTDQGNRVSMADKQMEQAISLKYREAPLVQSQTESGSSTFEKMLGTFSSHKSPIDGVVKEIHPDKIVVQSGREKHVVQLYNNFPLNDPKGVMHSETVVKVGDSVKKGQLLADTNYTKNGQLAIGSNLRVGYLPSKGYNYEDGIVISEGAAQKLTSDHLFKKKLEIDPETDLIHKGKFLANMAVREKSMPRHHIESLDVDGVIKEGTKVEPGQVLVAALAKNTSSRAGSALAALGKRAIQPYKDKSLVWDEDHVGTVIKVIKDQNGRGVKVYIKTEEQAVVGDKLSGRHGNKGIITQILPDHEMPFTVNEKGDREPLEVILNPLGVPTRINPGQILETAAAKIAKKTGKTYVVNNFSGPNTDYRSQVERELKSHGLSDEESVYDPGNPNKTIGSVLVGPQFLLKLKHQVEKKLTVRGGGTDLSGKPLPYDADLQPTKGGERGGQGFGQLDMYVLLGHNARNNLREMSTYKSDLQDIGFWTRIQQGLEPPAPRPSFAYEKFLNLIKAMGVNTVKDGTNIRLTPMTDKEILEISGGKAGEIKRGNLALRAKDLKEEEGGLFDRNVTGGLNGKKWGHIRLSEPVPNPIFVGQHNQPGPVPVLLGLKMSNQVNEFEDVMAGKKEIDGLTGGKAIEAALKKIDVGATITDLKDKLTKLRGSDLDRANKKLKYLLALKETGLKPHEAYVLHYLPVIPPVFRPATPTLRGDIYQNPLNGLYKNIAVTNDKLHQATGEVKRGDFTEDHLHPLRAELWDNMKALQSIGKNFTGFESDSHGRRRLKGVLALIGGGGDQPKEGYFQSKLVKRKQDLSIRSTIVPEPKLGLDEVGLPREAAMELYKPFVVAQLGKMGFAPLLAQEEMKKAVTTNNPRSAGYQALERVVEDRPMLLKRDPALHKFSIMAFKPKLVEGKAIQIHPLVTGGFNADFDGDTMAGTIPVSREAVEEARKLFPSRNLFNPTSGSVMYAPSQEAMLGLHLLSKWGKDSGKKFKTVAEVSKAVSSGEIENNDVIHVEQLHGKPTTFGRIMIDAQLPRNFHQGEILHDPGYEVTKKSMGAIVAHLAKNHQKDFAQSVNDLKDLGNEHAYRYGFSFGLKDLAPLKERDEIYAEAHRKADHARKSIKDPEKRDEAIIGAYNEATEKIDKAIKDTLPANGNRLAVAVFSGARGKPEQLRQMVAAPGLMQDGLGRTLTMPVTRSYSEGLDVGDYYQAQHGARKGTLQRAQGTSEPGALSKDIINTTMSSVIVSDDCKTNQGVLMDLKNKDSHDRFLAQGYKLKDGTNIKSGTLLAPDVMNRLKNSKIDKVLVRSPLKCQHGDGICAKCFGLNENGKLHDIGTNVGVLAGQSLGEPAVQMAMDSFHTGGLATGRGAESVDRFTRLRQLLSMPDKLKNSAILSRVSGKVTKVDPDVSRGGHNVHIGDEVHYVKREVKPIVSVGDEVTRGKPLSTGPINPHHLLDLTHDIHAVQNYLTNSLHEGLYEKEGVRRRNVEVVVRALTNLTKIRDPGGSDHSHGDVVPLSVAEEWNRENSKSKKPIVHDPILTGIEQVPLAGTDWMSQLNYRRLSSVLQHAATKGWKSNIHGLHPIPALAHGSEFGKPPPNSKKGVY